MSQQSNPKPAEKPANGRLVARMIESHSILGLAFAALIYIVSLTGAFTVFADEIALWENASAPTAEAATPQAYQAALEAAYAKRMPDARVRNVIAYGPSEFAPAMLVRLDERGAQGQSISTDWLADPATGELLGTAASPLSHLIAELHVALHLPDPWGRYLVGLLGVCMFSLLLSGILAHPSILRDAFKLRLDRNRRIAWTDMHNRLSVWGLPFHLVLTFTGGFLGLAGMIVGAVAMVAYDGDQERALASIQGLQPVEGRPLKSFPPIAKMVREARNGGKPIEMVLVNHVDSAGGVTQIRMTDDSTLDGRRALMFRNTGELVEAHGGKSAPGGIRALAMISPLHFGTFGGYPVKAIYFVMAMALTWVTSSGMKIWFARREQQGRPVPRLRAAWCGMTAGLTAGLALATLLAALGAGPAVFLACLAIWLLALSTFLYRPQRVKTNYRRVLILAAMALACAFAVSVVRHGPGAGIALAVNLSILLLASALAGFALRDGGWLRRPEAGQLPA